MCPSSSITPSSCSVIPCPGSSTNTKASRTRIPLFMNRSFNTFSNLLPLLWGSSIMTRLLISLRMTCTSCRCLLSFSASLRFSSLCFCNSDSRCCSNLLKKSCLLTRARISATSPLAFSWSSGQPVEKSSNSQTRFTISLRSRSALSPASFRRKSTVRTIEYLLTLSRSLCSCPSMSSVTELLTPAPLRKSITLFLYLKRQGIVSTSSSKKLRWIVKSYIQRGSLLELN